VANLCEDAFAKLDHSSGLEAISAHSEIRQRNIQEKSAAFYRSFLRLRTQMIALLADSYRRYFKLALAHPSQAGGDPHEWAWTQLQPALRAALEWIREWYTLACEGQNQTVRQLASVEFVQGGTASLSIPTTAPEVPPPSSWRGPAWLFGISLAYFGFGPLKQSHVPNIDPAERLGEAHTRLLLKGARRVFLWELRSATQIVQNEEIAAAAAIPAETVGGPNKGKGSRQGLKGIEGLGPKKLDFSRYMDNLTEKQRLACSLKYEHGLGLTEIASRMELDRKTAYEHIEAAKRKIDQFRSSEKSKVHRAKSKGE
jgi:DNA-binding CsgD family transcriptional regulator